MILPTEKMLRRRSAVIKFQMVKIASKESKNNTETVDLWRE